MPTCPHHNNIMYTQTHIFQSVVHSLGEGTPHNGHSEPMEAEMAATPSLPLCSAKDRALLLALALKWKKESTALCPSPEQLRVFEREIWVQHIRAAMESSAVSLLKDASVFMFCLISTHLFCIKKT